MIFFMIKNYLNKEQRTRTTSMEAGGNGKPFSNPNLNGNAKEIEIVT